MKTNKNEHLVPVRVFQAGSVQAVLWRPLQEARRVQPGRDGQVSLHRADQTPVGKPERLVLMTSEQLSQAIDALQQAREFLLRRHDDPSAASGMFLCAIDMLEVKAEW